MRIPWTQTAQSAYCSQYYYFQIVHITVLMEVIMLLMCNTDTTENFIGWPSSKGKVYFPPIYIV